MKHVDALLYDCVFSWYLVSDLRMKSLTALCPICGSRLHPEAQYCSQPSHAPAMRAWVGAAVIKPQDNNRINFY